MHEVMVLERDVLESVSPKLGHSQGIVGLRKRSSRSKHYWDHGHC